MPILKHQAENVAMKRLNQWALKQCDDKVRAFAECTRDKLISVIWKCRPHQKAVNECVLKYTKDQQLRNEFRIKHGRDFPQFIVGYQEDAKGEEVAR